MSFITGVILITIAIQVYWNYINYLSNKQQLVNDVQTSIDKAVDNYYANLAEATTLGFTFSGESQQGILEEGGFLERISQQIDSTSTDLSTLEINTDSIDGITILRGFEADSMLGKMRSNLGIKPLDSVKNQLKSVRFSSDSVSFTDFEMLTSKVVISITNDSLDIVHIDSLFKQELTRKRIDIDYNLNYNAQKPFEQSIDSTELVKESNKEVDELFAISKSTFLPKQFELKVSFKNVTKVILKRSLTGILISFVLVLAVIGSLFYLLKIIKNQKEAAEVKNDLISNITHEFKTPIATIGVALESLKDFNNIKDEKRSENYLNVSTDQLSKLNIMVEKLLETATLDTKTLNLTKEITNISELVEDCCTKHRLTLDESKSLEFSATNDAIMSNVDRFHFENAINNILDNAIKYGGNQIKVTVSETSGSAIIAISDNGGNISRKHKDKIFDKFYRIPKGNTHDVKGFGIGLYYAKTIIEKHLGNISLRIDTNLTEFKISLPNE